MGKDTQRIDSFVQDFGASDVKVLLQKRMTVPIMRKKTVLCWIKVKRNSTLVKFVMLLDLQNNIYVNMLQKITPRSTFIIVRDVAKDFLSILL